jgi:hypothetical protein
MRAMLVALSVLLVASCLAAESPDAELDRNIASVLPKPSEERWLQIPWRTDLAAARVEANREGKAMFLWMMDGNPLGCT